MLFAAGFGTRMGEMTRHRPKPLIEVAGKPLLDHALGLLDGLTLRPVVNTHYLADQIRDHLTGRDVAISDEQPQILETGGGLRHALPLLGDGPVVTMNTDAIWQGPNPVEFALSAWNPDEMDALLVCVPPARALGHKGQGDFTCDSAGRIRRGPGLIYGGVQIIRTEGLHDIDEPAFSLNLLWNRMIEQTRAYAVEYPGFWCDVGRPEGISLAETLLEQPDV